MRFPRTRDDMLRAFVTRTFSFWQKLGLHVLVANYHSPIPDTRKLANFQWEKRNELKGINLHSEGQLRLLGLFSEKYKKEYDGFPYQKTLNPTQFYLNNGAFMAIDAEVYYCMIRHFKPRRVIEIGSGFSTLLAAQAVMVNACEVGYECELISIEPYPNIILKAGFQGLSRLLALEVQEVPLSEFKLLRENDILFIDSSHFLKIGSDVQYEILEILPNIEKGVIVHVHDIHFPKEYPKRGVMVERVFANEQYLLQAFLTFNDHFEVLWGSKYMHVTHPDVLSKSFASYDKSDEALLENSSSFWIRKTR